jgi:Repulsive guidance molecule (RGM) C-terminus
MVSCRFALAFCWLGVGAASAATAVRHLRHDPPLEARSHRVLKEAKITREQAEAACAHVSNEEDKNNCIFDILSTDDIQMADAY